MNERLRPELPEHPKSGLDSSNDTFAHDGDESVDLSTDKDSFSENDEAVYIEPRVDGDEWILAQESFFERFPDIEVPTERVLIERLESGVFTVDALRKNYMDTEVQYETLAALLRGAPYAGVPFELPPLDSYFEWPTNEQDGFQTVLEHGLEKSQFATWIKEISGRFSSLTESLRSYRNVAKELGIFLEDTVVDSEAMAAK